MLFTRAPRGHESALATQSGPAAWKLPIFAIGLVALVVMVAVDVVVRFPSPVSGGLAGLIGALTVMGVGSRTYAVGPTWFRRGHQIVHINDLTSITVHGETVRLLDSRQTGPWARWLRPGRCTFPLKAVLFHPHLYGPLQSGMHTSTSRRQVRTNSRAQEAFALES